MFAKRRKIASREACNHAPGGPPRRDLSEHCARLFIVPGPGELVDLDEDDGELPPELEDPGRPFRRLIQAILLSSIEDFTESQDRQTHNEARAFLFPESTDKRAHLADLLECSGLNAGWFRDRCERLRLRAVAPEGQTASASRYNSKRRVQARCQAGL